jgi:hypothetical protein
MTTERCADPRRPAGCPHPVLLLSEAGAPIGTATPQDVSATGIRLTASCPGQDGALLTLAPQLPHPLAGQRLSFRVARCQALPEGGYLLAGVFLRPLTDAEVRGLAQS